MSYNSLTIRGSLGFNAGSVLEQKRSLVISHGGGVEVVPLVEGEPVTIGRAYPSDVVIAGRRLSRAHCRVELIDDEVWVEDLQSTNGTRVNGRVIRRSRMRLDDQVDLESTVNLTLHLLAPPAARLYGLSAHERFLVSLEDELIRARLFHRQVAMLMIRSATRDPHELALWAPRVRELLRPVDAVGLYGPDVLEVMLPEANGQAAHAVASRILAEQKEEEPPLRVGLALFPDNGSSGEELIALSRLLAQRASDTEPIQTGSMQLQASPEPGQGPLIAGPTLREVYQTVERVAASDIPVLILGETGTGKELVARSIHERSPRSTGPMRCINCGAIPQTLLESVLFGHERGAFTGADKRSKGVFEEAAGGTVLLDEVGELAPEAQVALLRVLETKRVTRVGSTQEVPVDVRILAATHRDPEAMAKEGMFRQDLLYRLNTMTIQVPPLRERREEISPLALHFLQLACKHHGCRVDAIAPEAMALLERFSWPGNVRQLRNVIERAVVMCTGTVVGIGLLPDSVRRNSQPGPASAAFPAAALAPPPDRPSPTSLGSRQHTEEFPVIRREAPSPRTSTPMWSPPPDGPDGSGDGFKDKVTAFETALLRSALTLCGGNQTHAAEMLDIPRRTLIYKLNSFGLDDTATTDEDRAVLAATAVLGTQGDYKARVERYEAHLLTEALAATDGNQAAAARALDMRRRTLMDKARRYGIEIE